MVCKEVVKWCGVGGCGGVVCKEVVKWCGVGGGGEVMWCGRR